MMEAFGTLQVMVAGIVVCAGKAEHIVALSKTIGASMHCASSLAAVEDEGGVSEQPTQPRVDFLQGQRLKALDQLVHGRPHWSLATRDALLPEQPPLALHDQLLEAH